ncbi:MAG: isoprenylcysteine carboxylmethyltransferase family protein [Desulfuromonadales bacterium]|nr:isoprenylcysteine carboxylmethyltransferase family protein [Desulfuromonadales bacterium]
MRWIVFLAATAFFAWVSRHALRNPLSHGFYRFFAWECILALVLLNFPVWTLNPFAAHQIASWSLLLISLALVINALCLLRKVGQPSADRGDAELLAFERTSTLVTTGTFRFIRHPMYASLLFLAWGAFLKDISWAGLALAAGASIALFCTALRDEAECCKYFGAPYADYMKTSKRFIPFVF